MKVYYEKDSDLELIKSKKIAIFGYGSQGHAHALNLKDSGATDVAVALREGSSSAKKAEAEGLKVMSMSDAAEWADIMMMLIPDELQADVWKNHIEQRAKQGSALAFAHGLNIHFDLIKARPDMDVFMVAPKGPGHTVRSEYKRGGGVPCLVAVDSDKTGNALKIALSYASAIGGGKAGTIETTFKDECETDLFGEQTVLCGGVVELIRNGFETLVEAGYQPESAYFETLHEVKLIVDLMYEGGFEWMRHSISDTAEYGDFSRGSRIITNETKNEMKKVLEEIQSGAFAKEWMSQAREGAPFLNQMREEASAHQIEAIGKNLRNMMPFLDAKDVKKDK